MWYIFFLHTINQWFCIIILWILDKAFSVDKWDVLTFYQTRDTCIMLIKCHAMWFWNNFFWEGVVISCIFKSCKIHFFLIVFLSYRFNILQKLSYSFNISQHTCLLKKNSCINYSVTNKKRFSKSNLRLLNRKTRG